MSSERKVREAVFAPPPMEGGVYGNGRGSREGETWNQTSEPEMSGPGVSLEENRVSAVEAPDVEGAEELEGQHAVRSDVNDALARLEMNTLEVKLYLDSIDQRISRMEPRLEGIRAEPQRDGSLPEGDDGSSRVGEVPVREMPARATVQDGMPTVERRRRIQGVPIERRRSPFADPLGDEGEDWASRPWAADVAGRVTSFTSRARKLPRRTLVPVAALVLVGVAGLGLLGLRHRALPEAAIAAAGAGPVAAGSAGDRSTKSSGQIAWAPDSTAAAVSGRGAWPVARAAPTRPGSVSVEQGVPAPPGSLGYVAPGIVAALPEVTGGGATGALRNGNAPSKPDAGVEQSGDESDAAAALRAAESSTVTDAASATASIGRGSGRVHVSSGVMAGNLIYSRPPVYPHGLIGLFHTEGSVRLQAVISRSGRVEDIKVLSGHYMLRGAAKDAVRSWRYRPYHVNGVPVEVATIVSVDVHR